MATSSPIPLPVYNPTADDIPPGGAMEPTGVTDADGRITVQKPTVSDSLAVLINGPTPILAGDSGSGFLPWVGPLAIAVDPTLLDSDGDLITLATQFGVQSGNWYFVDSQVGFVSQGDVFGGLMPVQANPGLAEGFFFAQLTSGSSPYSWQERVETSAGVWANGARSGTTNAYQAQPGAGTPSAPATNDVVMMRASVAVAGKYEFVLADKAGASSLPLITANGSYAGTSLSTNSPTTVMTITLAAGNWLVRYQIGTRLNTTSPGDSITANLTIVSGTGTFNVGADNCFASRVQVSGVTADANGSGYARLSLSTSCVIGLVAQRTAIGTVALASVQPTPLTGMYAEPIQ